MDAHSRDKKAGAPLGLLSPANADLYRRFEAEEAKTNHLRAKEKAQSTSLSQLTARLDGLNKSLLAEENHCDKRTAQVKEELDALDREEVALDVQLKLKKKQLQHMTTAVADIKVQLAYNFVSMPRHGGSQQRPATAGGLGRRGSTAEMHASPPRVHSAAQPSFNISQFAESLTDSEMAEIVGESYFVDDQGARHRVVFSDPGDEEDPMAPHRSPTTSASPSRSSNGRKHTKDEHRGGRLSRSGSSSGKASSALTKSMWLQSTGAKKATYLLLEDARRMTAAQLDVVQHAYQSGGYAVDATYTAEVTALQQQLDTIYQATHALLLTTPTSQSLLLNQPSSTALTKEASVPSGSALSLSRSASKGRTSSSKSRKVPSSPLHPVEGEDEAIAATVGRALPVLPATLPAFAAALAAQRRELIGLRHALRCEEELVEKRQAMQTDAWCAAAHSIDQRAFEASRVPTDAANYSGATGDRGGAPHDEPTTCRVPTPPAGQRNATASTAEGNRCGQPSANVVMRSNSVPRPASAPHMARYATAATRILHSKGHALTTCRKHEERYLTDGVGSGACTASEYHMRSHHGLTAAIESITAGARSRRRHTNDEHYGSSVGDHDA